MDESNFTEALGIDVQPHDVVGTGPFMLSSYTPGEKIVLTRNPSYWKQDASGQRLPYLDTLVYRIVENDDTALLQFQNGELDVYGVRGADYPLLKPKETGLYRAHSVTTGE